MPEDTTAETAPKHHPYSPSVLSRRIHCPASRTIEKDLPDEPGEAALAGTRIHAAIAHWIISGRTGDYGTPGILQTTDEQLSYEKCCAFIEHLHANEYQILPEYHMELKDIYGSTITEGTADVVWQDAEGVWNIIDWKTGRGEVAPADENWQGAAYAAMLAQTMKTRTVKVTFYQPALNRTTTHTFDDDELDNVTQLIINAVADGESSTPSCKAGDWCKYCRGNTSGKCNLSRYNAERALFVPSELEVGNMEDLRLAMEYERVQAAKAYASLLEEEIKRRCRESGKACGYTLKERPGTRTISDPQKAFETLNDQGLSQSSFIQCVTVSVADLEKAWWETAKMNRPADKVTLKQAKAELSEALGDIIERKPPTMVLTPVKEASDDLKD